MCSWWCVPNVGEYFIFVYRTFHQTSRYISSPNPIYQVPILTFGAYFAQPGNVTQTPWEFYYGPKGRNLWTNSAIVNMPG